MLYIVYNDYVQFIIHTKIVRAYTRLTRGLLLRSHTSLKYRLMPASDIGI